MNKGLILKVAYWTSFIAAGCCLYISLRTSYYQVEYSLLALAFWGGAYLVNRMMKKEADQ